MAEPRIYLDHNGSTPVTPEVAREMRAFVEGFWGNAGAGHPDGRAARAAIDDAAARVARALGGSSGEVTFTSGGTESNNAALVGALRDRTGAGEVRRHFVIGRHEHLSVVRCAQMLERRGAAITWVDPTPGGAVDPEAVRECMRDDTALVALMFANNETGVLQPVAEVAEIAHAHGALMFVDAVCGAGKVPIDVGALGCDLLSISGHKLHAPKGIGALWVREGVELEPLIHGCGQQAGRRSGTENTMGAVALGAALAAHGRPAPEHAAQVRSLRDRLLEGIFALEPRAERNGFGPDLPNTFSVWFPGRSALELQRELGDAGVSAAAQVARAASGFTSWDRAAADSSALDETQDGSILPSHVLLAMGASRTRASESLRFSLGTMTSAGEVDRALAVLRSTLRSPERPASTHQEPSHPTSR